MGILEYHLQRYGDTACGRGSALCIFQGIPLGVAHTHMALAGEPLRCIHHVDAVQVNPNT